MIRVGSILPSLLVLSLSLAPFSHAQAPGVRTEMRTDVPAIGDFTVGPARTILSLAPGEEKTTQVRIANREGRRAAFDLSAEDFSADLEREGTPAFFPSGEDGPFPAREWLDTAVSRIELAHGESAFIDVTVRVPASAQPGDHQTALIVTRDVASQPAGGFTIVSRVASLFIITVEGDAVQAGSVEGPEARSYLNFFSPVELTVRARNEGTMHMMPTGAIRIRNAFGMRVDDIPVNDWVVLRASSRERTFEWRPLFAFGRYTAAADLRAFDDGRNVAGGETAFWVIPVLPILGIIAAISVISFGIQRFLSRFEIRRKKGEK